MDIKNNPGLLLHKIGALMERSSDTLLFKEFGLGYSQFKIMIALMHHEGVQQKEIALFLGQTEASISRQIRLLKDAKLVDIVLGADDKKKHITTLTAKGVALLDDAMVVLNRFYEPVLGSLTPQEQIALTHQLAKIHDNLCSAYELTIK